MAAKNKQKTNEEKNVWSIPNLKKIQIIFLKMWGKSELMVLINDTEIKTPLANKRKNISDNP